MKGKRVQIILTEEIVEAMKEIADKQNSNFSAMARLAFSEWLAANHDIKVEYRLEWGGKRESE